MLMKWSAMSKLVIAPKFPFRVIFCRRLNATTNRRATLPLLAHRVS